MGAYLPQDRRYHPFFQDPPDLSADGKTQNVRNGSVTLKAFDRGTACLPGIYRQAASRI